MKTQKENNMKIISNLDDMFETIQWAQNNLELPTVKRKVSQLIESMTEIHEELKLLKQFEKELQNRSKPRPATLEELEELDF